VFPMARPRVSERNAPANPRVCQYCGVANEPENETCVGCGAALPVDLPRVCPKCNELID